VSALARPDEVGSPGASSAGAHRLVVNGERVRVRVEGSPSLATVLREQLGLTATKVACGRGECGACTVLIAGRVRMACITLAALVRDPVETSEGLAEESTDVRARFADSGAFQCGFCTPGQVVHATGLLRGELAALAPEQRRARVRHALSGNICRCTGYQALVDSVCAVAAQRAGESVPTLAAAPVNAVDVR
jgi:aerobic carbon-monoxide dehydrogenase small subunit